MKAIILVLSAVVFLSCNNQKNKDYIVANVIERQIEQDHPGKQLMEIHCYVCHSATASEAERLAPPMIAIKKHYINEGTTKEQFKAAMQEWIKNPTEENAKMFGAVRRFGVMVKVPYPEETIEQIADYMFDNKIEQPEWFDEHFKQGKGKHQTKGQKKQNK
jgi:hypothetical protein|nr:hypothetical protein [uncultured Psychroserpens sp.]